LSQAWAVRCDPVPMAHVAPSSGRRCQKPNLPSLHEGFPRGPAIPGPVVVEGLHGLALPTRSAGGLQFEAPFNF
jgi:hypothetical protein